jgi:hypothetical protein
MVLLTLVVSSPPKTAGSSYQVLQWPFVVQVAAAYLLFFCAVCIDTAIQL